MEIRGRDRPEYRDLKERFEGWVLYLPTPWGAQSGLMTYMINYDKLTDADPEELNNFLSSYCSNSNMLIIGLTKRNQRKFASALEAMSFTRNTIVFYGDVFNEDILDMADRRILYKRAGTKVFGGFYETLVSERDQWIFEIGGISDFNIASAICKLPSSAIPIYFIPKWDTDSSERTVERSLYLYKYITHAYRIAESIKREGINVHVGLDLRVLMETAKDGDPDFLKEREYQNDP